ncbi:MAG: hypothetical protein WDM81_20455 [Rhizomicrobium sp.]
MAGAADRALNVTEGDVATLSGRLAQIRTWTYAANRSSWTRDSAHWQGVTRAVEDRLSDALHEQLTQRFIDRRTSVLMKRLREDDIIDLTLDDSGGVAIGGEVVGKLEGFRFEPDARAEGIHGPHPACRRDARAGGRVLCAGAAHLGGGRQGDHAQRARQAVVGRRGGGASRGRAVARWSRAWTCWPTSG